MVAWVWIRHFNFFFHLCFIDYFCFEVSIKYLEQMKVKEYIQGNDGCFWKKIRVFEDKRRYKFH